jgi:hypothetical protein
MQRTNNVHFKQKLLKGHVLVICEMNIYFYRTTFGKSIDHVFQLGSWSCTQCHIWYVNELSDLQICDVHHVDRRTRERVGATVSHEI